MRDSIKSLSRIQRFCLSLILCFAFVSVLSCFDDKEKQRDSGVLYDSNQPVKIMEFCTQSAEVMVKTASIRMLSK